MGDTAEHTARVFRSIQRLLEKKLFENPLLEGQRSPVADEVIVLEPVYDSYGPSIELAGGRDIFSDLRDKPSAQERVVDPGEVVPRVVEERPLGMRVRQRCRVRVVPDIGIEHPRGTGVVRAEIEERVAGRSRGLGEHAP